MTLEELIFNRLAVRTQLTSKLARFDTFPAIFYQSPPEDQADGWGGRTQYPRIDYGIEMQANPERHTSGQMALNIWCSEDGIPPEEIEPEIRQTLNDVFFAPAAGTPLSLTWSRSDTFEAQAVAVKGAGIRGITIMFDVWAFTSQQTHEPDPIRAISAWTKTQLPGAMVIGLDVIPSQFMSSELQPVVYYRLLNIEIDRHAGQVTWLNVEIAGHIMTPLTGTRLRILRNITDRLVTQKRIRMPDNSPLFIQNLSADSSNNHLATGQLRIRATFGILSSQESGTLLLHPHVSTK